jgi:hypothetical protein
MRIRMIKKLKADGMPCRKCLEVEQRLQDAGLLDKIDQIIIADERNPDSEGMQLARQYQVESAPFFLVEDDAGTIAVYTIYYQFLKEVLNRGAARSDAVA